MDNVGFRNQYCNILVHILAENMDVQHRTTSVMDFILFLFLKVSPGAYEPPEGRRRSVRLRNRCVR